MSLEDHSVVMWPTSIPRAIDFPHRIVAVVPHDGRLFLATEQRIYELVDGMWRPMIFVNGDEGMASGG